MGKSNAKKSKPCGYIKPHPAHVYEHQSSMPYGHREKRWCGGIGMEQQQRTTHVHVWDRPGELIFKPQHESVKFMLADPGFEGDLWQGPFECSCGKSVWLTDGVRKRDLPERFPKADIMDRIMALKGKLASGKELDDRDKEELQAMADALIAAMQPLIEAFGKMVEQVGEYLQAFFDSISPETWAQLSELAKAYGEKPDEVATVELVDFEGSVIDTVMVTAAPASAVNAISLQEDSAFPHVPSMAEREAFWENR